jgi:hypothetical protein
VSSIFQQLLIPTWSNVEESFSGEDPYTLLELGDLDFIFKVMGLLFMFLSNLQDTHRAIWWNFFKFTEVLLPERPCTPSRYGDLDPVFKVTVCLTLRCKQPFSTTTDPYLVTFGGKLCENSLCWTLVDLKVKVNRSLSVLLVYYTSDFSVGYMYT